MPLMRQLTLDLKSARRLSATFRFKPGKLELDSKSQQDMVRLAKLLQSGTLRGQQVILAGFADAVGEFERNTALSLSRAEKVREALLKASKGVNPKQIVVKGYSELMPVDCNSNDGGKQKNRRVEVWVRDDPARARPAPSDGRVNAIAKSGSDS